MSLQLAFGRLWEHLQNALGFKADHERKRQDDPKWPPSSPSTFHTLLKTLIFNDCLGYFANHEQYVGQQF